MDIKNIRVSIRRNLGDYEAAELSLDAELGVGDDPQECINILRATIESNLLPRNFHSMSDKEQEAALKIFNKAVGKGTKTKAPKEPAKTEEAPVKAKRFKAKNTPLDPNKELHKKLFGQAMTEVVPNWRKKEILQKKAGKIMKKLSGTDLIDSEGEVLESFVDAIRAEFK